MKNLTSTKLSEIISCDKISKFKGQFKFKRFFFYTHGASADSFAERILKALAENGFNNVREISRDEFWNAWPKDSWFEVVLEILPNKVESIIHATPKADGTHFKLIQNNKVVDTFKFDSMITEQGILKFKEYLRAKNIELGSIEYEMDNSYFKLDNIEQRHIADPILSSEYTEMVAEQNAFDEHNDCSVKAIAIACGITYKKAHGALKKAGRKNGRGTKLTQSRKAILDLGCKIKSIDPQTILDQYPKWVTNNTPTRKATHHITTKHPMKFPKVWKDGCSYIMVTKGHMLAIVDGENKDWTKEKAYNATHIWRIS